MNQSKTAKLINKIIGRDEHWKIAECFKCRITSFDDIVKAGQGSYSVIPGWGDRYLWEGVAANQRGLDKYRGGIIVFSTDVNAEALSDSKIASFFKQKWATIKNRLLKNRIVTQSVIKTVGDGVGFSIGNFFKGRYVSNGRTFDEKSATVELLGQPSEILIALATEMARQFQQETVLLKDFNTGENRLIDQL